MSGRTWQWFKSWIFCSRWHRQSGVASVSGRSAFCFSRFWSLLVKVMQEGAERGDTHERCKDFRMEKKARWTEKERTGKITRRHPSPVSPPLVLLLSLLFVCFLFLFSICSLYFNGGQKPKVNVVLWHRLTEPTAGVVDGWRGGVDRGRRGGKEWVQGKRGEKWLIRWQLIVSLFFHPACGEKKRQEKKRRKGGRRHRVQSSDVWSTLGFTVELRMQIDKLSATWPMTISSKWRGSF